MEISLILTYEIYNTNRTIAIFHQVFLDWQELHFNFNSVFDYSCIIQAFKKVFEVEQTLSLV